MTSSFPIRTLPDICRYYAATRAGTTALSFEGRLTSFEALDTSSSDVAAALRSAGIGSGDRISYLGKNCDRYFVLLMGAAKIGAVMVPLNWRLSSAEITYILQDCGAKILFVATGFEGLARDIRGELHGVGMFVGVDTADADFTSYRAWLAARDERAPTYEEQADDVVVQIYTSGTTGRPKGAMLTHTNFLNVPRLCWESEQAWMKWREDDIALVALPVGHVGGTTWGLWVLAAGVTAIVRREFDAEDVLELIENEGLNTFFLVPATLQLIVRRPRARTVDYSRLRKITYGASPIPSALLRECMDVFKCGFVQFYGMTETAGAISVLAPDDHGLDDAPKMRSAGRPLPGCEVAIVDDAGTILGLDQPGEIIVRSAAVMAGYWNLPEATRAALTGDGWLRTGDVGYLDRDGYLYIHDRLKDTIISGGENIYPAEVEDALYGHEAVSEVAVIGVPSDTWGEEVKALVVLKPGAEATAAALVDHAAARIARFKLPKTVEFIETMPRNASGKILRRQLREPYWKDLARNVN